jgi:hypothetical protein
MRMGKIATLAAVLLFVIPAWAGDDTPPPEPTQNPDASYRLYRTLNIYTLLRLDPRTGQVWQVQWGDEDHRFTVPLNSLILLPAGAGNHPAISKPGRFTLYPTQNVYTFVLLDQEDGRAWQVQWGDEKHRFIVPIP